MIELDPLAAYADDPRTDMTSVTEPSRQCLWLGAVAF